jgi:hypothetical protein
MKKSHPNAIWITSTHKKIWEINKICQNKIESQGARVIRVIANHIPSRISVMRPDRKIRDELYSVTGENKGTKYAHMMTHLDLCIGTRVRLIRQISVELGLYNGAMGTVYGFVYKGSGPDQSGSETSDASIKFCDLEDEQREIPIVLVQMDGDNYPHSCSDAVPRLIPIVAVVGDSNIKTDYKRIQLPILPAHARTAHSVQGYTAHDGAVIDSNSKFFAGDYVACSRAKSLEQLILLQPMKESSFLQQPDFRIQINQEYQRLNQLFPQ